MMQADASVLISLSLTLSLSVVFQLTHHSTTRPSSLHPKGLGNVYEKNAKELLGHVNVRGAGLAANHHTALRRRACRKA